jgi:Mg-chelatase subunit ChlD
MGNLFSRAQRHGTRRPNEPFDSLDNAAVGIPIANGTIVPTTPNTNSDAQRLALSATSDRVALAYGTEQEVLAMLSIKAPAAVSDVSRPPLDLVACIDRSGSMRGQKIVLMKQTLEMLVKRAGLREGDRVSLVSFDTDVKLELPLTSMDSTGRANAEHIVKKLSPGSTTNLSGGALKAIDVFQSDEAATDKDKDEKRTRAVMLFTDGHANVGITDTPRLVSAVSGALAAASAQVGGPISLFTFGFGADHNEDMLRALATGSGANGLYYFVNGVEDIPNAFADCLGGLTSVVAQNATLSFAPVGPGVAVSRVLGSTYERDADGAIVLGDLFAEDEKDVLVELTLPKLDAPTGSTIVLEAKLRAFNVARSAPDAVEVQLKIARPEATPADQPVNMALDTQRNRIFAAEAMEQASNLADRGNLDGGREMLRAVRDRMAQSASAQIGTPLSMNLVKEVDELYTQYESSQRYRSVGSKMSKMQAVAHSRQRATHSNAEAYAGGAKRKMAMKAAWGLKQKGEDHVFVDGSGSDSN